MRSPLLSLLALVTAASAVAAADELTPLMVVPGEIVLQEDLSESKELAKKIWQRRQGTRWSIEDGARRGRGSSPEYQAKKKGSNSSGNPASGTGSSRR